MALRFEEIRLAHQHSGNKGANVEQIVREFLREFLPPYNRIGQGEVIDRDGSYSRQIDVIVTNEHHPYLNDLANPSIFICEGVACAGEVKSVLTGDELERALVNCQAFKSLKIRMEKGAMVHSNPEDLERFVGSRPYFLFAFESRLATATIKERIDAWNSKNAIPLKQQIDSVFVLTGGNIVNFGTGKGSLQFRTPDGKSLEGYIYPNPKNDPALLAFLSWISATMPRISIPSPPILSYLVKTTSELEQNTKTTD
jgi:hypothetical protein